MSIIKVVTNVGMYVGEKLETGLWLRWLHIPHQIFRYYRQLGSHQVLYYSYQIRLHNLKIRISTQ